MKLFRKIIIKIIHNLGFDIVRIQNDYDNPFEGLTRFPIRTIIDIGANRGQFAKKALQAFPNAYLYCFEPLKAPFEELKKWASEQNNRVTVFNLALGDSEGITKMFLLSEHNDSSSFLKSTVLAEALWPFMKKQELVSVKLTSLDKVVSNLSKPFSPEILIKIDVEGYEDRVIQGGKKILAKTKACILEISLDFLHENQPSFKKIFSLMDELKFHYIGNLNQVYAKDGHIVCIDALFLK